MLFWSNLDRILRRAIQTSFAIPRKAITDTCCCSGWSSTVSFTTEPSSRTFILGQKRRLGNYDETFPEGAAHPLVEKARQGRLKPDLRVFAEGVDGDPKAQALTLVMLTIGLPEADQPTTAQIVAHNKANAGKKRRGNQVDSAEETETQKTNGSRRTKRARR